MKIEEAINWIHSRLPFGSRPGLDRVEALLEVVGHPEEKVKTIHIAGTNGKGSTVTYLRYLLEEAGLTVGTFTSPYIESFNERISINGQGIPDESLIRLVKKYQPLVEQMDQFEAVAGITEFETLTAMAFDYFLEEQVDVAIIEVGLGGLLDSTNVAKPLLTGITTIGMDHTDILGDTIEEIAAQKAGIIKQNVPLVTGNIVPEALAVIEKQAKLKNATQHAWGEAYTVSYKHPAEEWGEIFSFQNEFGKIPKLTIHMIGKHQVENAGMAIEMYQIYCGMMNLPFREKDVINGLKKAQWPGRMERLSEEPLVILDGAHNTHAMARLVQNLKQEFKGYHIHLLFSALRTKEVDKMLHQLQEVPDATIYVTTFDYPKAIELSDIQATSDEKVTIVSMWQFGLAEILEKMTAEDVLVVTGSLYFISEVRRLLVQLGVKMKVNAVIFDMDGLLFDTEIVYYEASQTVADRMGFPYDKDLYLRFLGVSDEEVWANYHTIFANFGRETVQKFIDDSYQETLDRFALGQVKLKSGVLEFLNFLEEKDIPKVVASSNQRHVIELLLEKNNLRHRFDMIVSAENVKRAKPDPEIFLHAQALLGTEKAETLILEDSQNGVLAAYGAGIPVIMVPDLLAPSDELAAKTTAIVSSLHEVPALIK